MMQYDLPRLDETNVTNALPFEKEFISFVLYKYLFEGEKVTNIEQEYYRSAVPETGALCVKVLNYFSLISATNAFDNRGIYAEQDVEAVANFLISQEKIEYKKIGEALLRRMDVDSVVVVEDSIDESKRIKNAFNMIYYGTPGCGKSFLVNKDYNESEYLVVRTTFYPDYSNSDFVGQIIPKVKDERVYYSFQEGPFSLALLEAYKNPEKKVCLVIEEINRGNASAIFGDIFQLLDRDAEGNSIYKIDNYLITNYFADKGINKYNKVFIPSNLWIIGTMNSSDQNVYTLDTAFKRRWRMNRIVNEFSDDNKLANLKVPGSSYNWKEFVVTINRAILENNPGGFNGEDKQLGVYFVSENELESSNTTRQSATEAFVEKVLMYIWSDIAKIDPTLWFNKDFKSFDELAAAFYTDRLAIFKGLFDNDLKKSEDIL